MFVLRFVSKLCKNLTAKLLREVCINKCYQEILSFDILICNNSNMSIFQIAEVVDKSWQYYYFSLSVISVFEL